MVRGTTDSIPALFEGAPGHLLPLASGSLMRLVNMIIAKGVCQRGISPTFFSIHLVTGDHITAMNYLLVSDGKTLGLSVG